MDRHAALSVSLSEWRPLHRPWSKPNTDVHAVWYGDVLHSAIFGGTFDPIHNAHLAVARAARDRFGLDRVLLIPAATPPHKQGRAVEEWAHRYAMVELACRGERDLEASSLESGARPSYSIETIERVAAGLPAGSRLSFLIGADAFAEIESWHRWQDVVRAVDFLVVSRPGHEYRLPAGARVQVLDGVHMHVSSSVIREKLARCEAPEELPGPVFAYIREHRLYGFGSACDRHPPLPLASDPISQ